MCISIINNRIIKRPITVKIRYIFIVHLSAKGTDGVIILTLSFRSSFFLIYYLCKTDHKDAKWICDLFMCDMIKPSFILPADIHHLQDLVRYRFKLTCMITCGKNRVQNCLTVSNLKLGHSVTPSPHHASFS